MSYDPKNRTFRQTVVLAVNAERTNGAVKNEMFWHCRRCISEKGNLADGLELFLSRCAEEERWVVSEEAGQMKVEAIPQLWQQGKSDCKRAIEQGVDPRDYESYHKMREKKIEASKAKQGVKAATSPEREAKTDTLAAALADGSVIDSRNSTICPEDLLPVVAAIAPLKELGRQRVVNRLVEIARAARKEYEASKTEGERRKVAA